MSLAIKYAMMKRKKKCHGGAMAEGGSVDSSSAMSELANSVKKAFGTPEAKAQEVSKRASSNANESDRQKSIKKAFHAEGYASGGDVDGYSRGPREKEGDELRESEKEDRLRRKAHHENPDAHVRGVHKDHRSRLMGGKQGESPAGDDTRWAGAMKMSNDPESADFHNKRAKNEHKKVLGDMHKMKHKDRKYLAEGGEVEDEMESGYEPMPCEKCGHHPSHAVENQGEGVEEDMIGRIMSKRKGFSKGGRVANDTPPVADFEDNQFDDLVKDDELAFHETGENSGDELGDEQEDDDRRDIVSKIMKSRKKKDRMPRPA